MKRPCPDCDGTGKCPDCWGEGEIEDKSLAEMKLDRGHKHFDELRELQGDVKRITRQADELCKLRPQFKSKFISERISIVNSLERMAQKLLEK